MRVLGHRGAAAVAPENTVAGVRRAFADGADGVEVDVRRTADGVLVCSHDPSLERLGGPAAPVASLAWDALAGVRLGGGEPVARVGDVLDAAAGRGTVVLEVKNLPGEPDFDSPDEATARLLADLLAARAATGVVDDVVVSSFNWFAIDAVRAARSTVPTAFLTPPGIDLAACLAYVVEHGHAQCHPHWSAVADEAAETAGTPRTGDPAETVAAAHAAGVAVVCWTVDDPAVARRLAAYGVDGVITNAPAALRSALG